MLIKKGFAMNTDFHTPGVYLEEPNGLSLSIQSGETAVPVFVGHFEFVPAPSDQAMRCIRVDSWLNFTQQFKADASDSFHIDASNADKPRVGETHLGAFSVRLFFENGGGACYVLPLNAFSDDSVKKIGGVIELCPDITLLCWCEHRTKVDDQKVVTALTALTGSTAQGSMQGRFLLIDAMLEKNDGNHKIIAPQVKDPHHAAAYFPALRTTYRFATDIDQIKIKNWTTETSVKKIGELRTHCEMQSTALINRAHDVIEAVSAIKNTSKSEYEKTLLSTNHSVKEAIDRGDVSGIFAKITEIKAGLKNPVSAIKSQVDAFLEKLHAYGKGKQAHDIAQKFLSAVIPLAKQPVILRASVAMAGVYARTDRERGVWKAPANVELNGVDGLVSVDLDGRIDDIRIDDALNDKLVQHKVNTIRAFSGRGHVVWGARTMTNLSEPAWRYVPVRRLFSTVERDVQDALRVALFEPNSQPTWMRVRGAVASYLHRLWEQGALMGDTPQQAYFVRIGLNETMTSDDVVNGRMIVRVGIAAVRPAEFIILQLTQDMVST